MACIFFAYFSANPKNFCSELFYVGDVCEGQTLIGLYVPVGAANELKSAKIVKIFYAKVEELKLPLYRYKRIVNSII